MFFCIIEPTNGGDAMKNGQKNTAVSCESCVFYDYDEEYDEYD